MGAKRKMWRGILSVSCLLTVLPAPAAGWVKGKKPEPLFGLAAPLPYSLRGAVYAIPSFSTLLPDFKRLRPVGLLYTYSLNVPKRLFTEGMPGVTDRIEWFAIDCEAEFWVRGPGKYRFRLTSDDGSRLSIDDRVVIDNDGVHETEAMGGSVLLESGRHHIRVSYFQGPRDFVALVLEVAPPGQAFRVFDTRRFRPPPESSSRRTADSPNDRPHLCRDPAFRGSAALKQYEMAAYKALRTHPPAHAFDFRAAAFRFPAENASSRYVLTFEVPGANLTATPRPDGRKNRLHAVLLALVKDASGQVVGKASQNLRAEVTDQEMAALRADTLTYTYPVTLATGRYTVEAAVVDREAGRASTGSRSTMPHETAWV
jgi:hypothetical protein